MLRAEHIVKCYGTNVALDDVEISLKESEVILLIGENGAGKTTLLKILLGLIYPDKGRVEMVTKNIGYMPEEQFGKSTWRVFPYLKMMGSLRGLPGDESARFAEELLRKYDLWESRKKNIGSLSKGMRQKVKWIQAIMGDNNVLVLDEPTSGLDPVGKRHMRGWILEERNKGKSILISTHFLEEMQKIADRCIIIHKGKIINVLDSKVFEEKDISDLFYEMVSKE